MVLMFARELNKRLKVSSILHAVYSQLSCHSPSFTARNLSLQPSCAPSAASVHHDPPEEARLVLQGTGVEFYAAQPGLVSSPLYSKGDKRKLSLNLVNFVQSFYGQAPVRGCRSLLRAVTDPELTGKPACCLYMPYTLWL